MTFEEWMEQAYYPDYPVEGWEIDDMREAWEAAWDEQQRVIDEMHMFKDHVLVPREPTQAMQNVLIHYPSSHPVDVYKALIQAAQEG